MTQDDAYRLAWHWVVESRQQLRAMHRSGQVVYCYVDSADGRMHATVNDWSVMAKLCSEFHVPPEVRRAADAGEHIPVHFIVNTPGQGHYFLFPLHVTDEEFDMNGPMPASDSGMPEPRNLAWYRSIQWREVERGLAESYPACCIAFYSEIWAPLRLIAGIKDGSDADRVLEDYRVRAKANGFDYIPCPKCLVHRELCHPQGEQRMRFRVEQTMTKICHVVRFAYVEADSIQEARRLVEDPACEKRWLEHVYPRAIQDVGKVKVRKEDSP